MVEGKGHRVLLDSLEAINTPFQATLVGDGPERTRLQRQADALGLSPYVIWAGEVSPSRLPTLYRSSHVLVVPSLAASTSSPLLRGEGTPRILLEAMSHGCVPIASRVGGIPDIVEHGVNGLLFPPGDFRTLADLLTQTSIDPAFLHGLRGNALQTAHRYGFDQMWSRWREALQVAI
jgi:glycosyltransferase involved in cell wall biosynthesis